MVEIAPCLYNIIGARARRSRSVADGCHARKWVQDIAGTLTVQVLLEYLKVWELVDATVLCTSTQDKLQINSYRSGHPIKLLGTLGWARGPKRNHKKKSKFPVCHWKI